MRTLNTVFVDWRLASSKPIGSPYISNETQARAQKWLARLRYLRTLCYQPGNDPLARDYDVQISELPK